MKQIRRILLSVMVPWRALAHGGDHDPGSPWSLESWVAVTLLVSIVLYATGVIRLWRRTRIGKGVKTWQAVSFAFGWICLAIALVSPVHQLGERLFTAHMLEHEILMTVAAPLLVLARPVGGMLWALPAAWRSALGRASKWPLAARVWQFLIDPLAATLLHGVAIWIWHAPVLFNAALTDPVIHGLQHVCFFATALLFWWSLLRGRTRERGYGAAVLYLFVTALHSGFLGILLSLAKQPLYPGQTVAAPEWGLTGLEDQQLAGLIMWVPAGLIYAVAALAMTGLWIGHSGRHSFRGGLHASTGR
jgi:cytochrome c oxidase assembly factor CtaG